MAAFVRAGDRLLNLDAVVDVRVSPALPARKDEYGDDLPAQDVFVEIVTTATTSSFDDGGDFPGLRHADIHPYTVHLHGDDARAFLARVWYAVPGGKEGAANMARGA